MKVPNMAVLGILVGALMIGASGLASGQDRPADHTLRYSRAEAWEISPFFGNAYFENKQNLKDDTVYGARLGYNATRRISIEATLETIRTRVDDRARAGGGPGQYRAPMDRVDLTFYHLDFVYSLAPGKRFSPFVVAGIGGAHYNPKISTKDMPAIGFGVGAKYWMGKDFALRVDLRDQVVSEIFRHKFHNYSATVGLVFAFGGKSRPATVQAPPTPMTPVPSEPKREVIVVSKWPQPDVEDQVNEAVKAPETKTIVLAFEDVHFAFDKSTLNAEAKAILDRSIRILQDHPSIQIRIAGYTSASGSDEYNQRLSERRAKSVQEYLIRQGLVSSDRLSTIGYGENNPAEYEVAPKNLYSKAARANMRVLFETIVN